MGIIDPDIIGGIGDDYAQFCTYDEKIALKEGFEEETIEEFSLDWDRKEIPIGFQVNDYITLQLCDNFIQIYVNEVLFTHCRYLLIVDPLKHENQEEIRSIDEAETFYNNDLEEKTTPEKLGITKELLEPIIFFQLRTQYELIEQN